MKPKTLNFVIYKNKAANPVGHSTNAAAFTCVDLIVTIAALLALSAVIIPALGRATASGPAAQCMNNLRQQGVAWAMYSADADSLIECHPWLSVIPGTQSRDSTKPNIYSWAPGYAGNNLSNPIYAPTANYVSTNPVGLMKTAYFPYLKDISLFHCPADRRFVSNSPVLRSFSMNNYMNGAPYTGVFRKMEQITRPSATWVMIDEDALTIDDSYFAMFMDDRGFVSLPGRRHENSYTMNYADGRVETYTLKDPTLINATVAPGGAGIPNSAGTAEYRFLTNLTTYP